VHGEVWFDAYELMTRLGACLSEQPVARSNLEDAELLLGRGVPCQMAEQAAVEEELRAQTELGRSLESVVISVRHRSRRCVRIKR
jgi:hypothetical protein